MLTVEQIQAVYDECDKKSDGGNEFMLMFASAIEAAATEPLLKRIAEFEQNNRDLSDDVQIFRKHAMNEKDARIELERQLVEARKQMEAQKDEWLSWEAKRKALEKDAERWREWEKVIV